MTLFDSKKSIENFIIYCKKYVKNCTFWALKTKNNVNFICLINRIL
jgi:hypothetical protein